MVISPRYVIPDLIIIKGTTLGFHLGLGLIDLLVGISQKNLNFRQVASDCDHALQKVNTLKGVIQYNLTENNIEGRQ